LSFSHEDIEDIGKYAGVFALSYGSKPLDCRSR
jgi:hypothetical protein